jgi:peptide/nickel transport system permease protein
MTNYLIRRFFQMIIVVLLSTMAIYMILNIAPGGPLAGMRSIGDRRNRPSEADMARLEAYLGIDKPLFMRYLTWLIGDDWLGADWLYIGLGQYRYPKLSATGEQLVLRDPSTGEATPQWNKARFWADPGPALLNPGYPLWVWGEKTGDHQYAADQIQVKPPAGAARPEDLIAFGKVLKVVGQDITIEDAGGIQSTVTVDEDTTYTFPKGEGSPKPEQGLWLNISALTGYAGLLKSYSGFHGDANGILRLDFGWSWKLAIGQPVTALIRSRLANTLILMTTATVISLVIAIPIGIYSGVHQYSTVDYAVTTFAFFGSAMPVFWFGLMLILLFSYMFKEWGLPYMPTGGTVLVREAQAGSMEALLNVSKGSLWIALCTSSCRQPCLACSTWLAGAPCAPPCWRCCARIACARRAKGLIERVVITKHARVTPSFPYYHRSPQIRAYWRGDPHRTVLPIQDRTLYFEALGQSDWPVVMAILFITAILVVVSTLLGDVLYTVVDPRIRFK